jgi:hypothetical protein
MMRESFSPSALPRKKVDLLRISLRSRLWRGYWPIPLGSPSRPRSQSSICSSSEARSREIRGSPAGAALTVNRPMTGGAAGCAGRRPKTSKGGNRGNWTTVERSALWDLSVAADAADGRLWGATSLWHVLPLQAPHDTTCLGRTRGCELDNPSGYDLVSTSRLAGLRLPY